MNVTYFLLNFLIIGILTIITLALVALGLYFRKQSKRKEKLRIALLSELNSMKELEEWPPQGMKKPIPSHDFFPTSIFQSNAHNIGKLTVEEIKAVGEFYSLCFIIKDQIERYHANKLVSGEKINSSLDDLKAKRGEAIDRLSRTLLRNP